MCHNTQTNGKNHTRAVSPLASNKVNSACQSLGQTYLHPPKLSLFKSVDSEKQTDGWVGTGWRRVVDRDFLFAPCPCPEEDLHFGAVCLTLWVSGRCRFKHRLGCPVHGQGCVGGFLKERSAGIQMKALVLGPG